jgi:hypothetical protein
MGRTMYPYCRYLRVLDLRDLTNLLEDEKFRGKVVRYVEVVAKNYSLITYPPLANFFGHL